MTQKHNELINAVCDNFNFARVASTMLALNWQWRDGVPTEFELRQEVRQQFVRAMSRNHNSAHSVEGTGGFMYHVYRENGGVVFAQLDFVLESSECDVDWLED